MPKKIPKRLNETRFTVGGWTSQPDMKDVRKMYYIYIMYLYVGPDLFCVLAVAAAKNKSAQGRIKNYKNELNSPQLAQQEVTTYGIYCM